MGKIGEFFSKHKVPILIVLGLVGVYVLYELLSSSSSSTDPNAAAEEAAAQQEADLQAAYAAQGSGASTPASATTSSLVPTVAAVTAQPTTSSSGSLSCPAGYQLDPTGTQCVLSSNPAPIATAPTGIVTQPGQPYAPAANSPLAAAAAASGGVNSNAGATGGATGVVGNIVSQWSAIFSPTNPFEINNPSMGANAAQTINNATSTFCANNPTDPSCNAANLALASVQATADQTAATTPYSADSSTETDINNPAPTTNGSGNPIIGGQRLAGGIASGVTQLTAITTSVPNIPATGTTPPQPVTIASSPATIAPSRGLTSGLSALVPNATDLLAAVGPHTQDISGGSF